MSILLLSGPAGAGKNSISKELAKLRKKCARVDVDEVRWMILKPHKAPWEGEEGMQQLRFGIRNSCELTHKFNKEGYDVIILDVVMNDTYSLYKEMLGENNFKTVLLLPTFEEIIRRNDTRPRWLTDERIKILYDLQSQFKYYDEKMDNTNLSIDECAKKLDRMF